MNTVLVAARGVIYDDNWKANELGKAFLLSLIQSYRVMIALDHNEVDRFNLWAKLEGIKGYQEAVSDVVPTALRGYDTRLGQVQELRGRGYDLTFVVEPDPDRAAEILKQGVSCLLFCHAKYMKAEFRPDWDETIMPWADLIAEIEHQHIRETDLEDEVDG